MKVNIKKKKNAVINVGFPKVMWKRALTGVYSSSDLVVLCFVVLCFV